MTIIARDDVEPDDTALYFVRGIDGCSEIEALAPDDRHAGAYDVARVVAAVTVVSVLSYVGLGILHGLGSVSRGVMVIQWMAVTLGILFFVLGSGGCDRT